MPKRCLRNALKAKVSNSKNSTTLPERSTRQVSSVQSLWRTACETAEQQQDSCPNHAKQQPEKMPKRCLRNALKAKVSNSKNSTTLPERSTRQVSSVQSLWRTACETAEQQQDSCPNHAKQQPEKMPKRCLRNALKLVTKGNVSNSKNSTTLLERSTRQGL